MKLKDDTRFDRPPQGLKGVLWLGRRGALKIPRLAGTVSVVS